MRLIDADAFLKSEIERCGCVPLIGSCTADNENFKFILEAQPTIEAKEVIRGEWEETGWVRYDGHGECIRYFKEGLRCSNCCHVFKKELLWNDNFCPNCGADMRG